MAIQLLMVTLFQLAACSRSDRDTDLKPRIIRSAGPHWLFVPGGHIDIAADEASLIADWLTSHDTGWHIASVLDFDPLKTQFLTAKCCIEIDGDRIVVTYMRDQQDLDSAVYIQRSLSPDEQRFWQSVLAQINRPNQALQPTPPGVFFYDMDIATSFVFAARALGGVAELVSR